LKTSPPKKSDCRNLFKVPGIYQTWPDAEVQVKGFSGAKYKKFKSKQEAASFIQSYQTSAVFSLENNHNRNTIDK